MNKNKIKQIITNKWWIAGAIIIIIVVGSIIFSLTGPPVYREEKHSYVCAMIIRRIAAALHQYSREHGTFPQDLKTLADTGYIKAEELNSCDKESSFLYVKGLKKDMPSNLPILVESACRHTYFPKGGEPIQYGRVLYLDYTIQSFSELTLQYSSREAKKAMNIMIFAEKKHLRDMVKNPHLYNFLEHAVLLWRLRQKPLIISQDELKNSPRFRQYFTGLSKQIKKTKEQESYYYKDLRPALRQASYLQMELHYPGSLRTLADPWRKFLLQDLNSSNYLLRKQTWKIISSDKIPAQIFLPKNEDVFWLNLSEKTGH